MGACPLHQPGTPRTNEPHRDPHDQRTATQPARYKPSRDTHHSTCSIAPVGPQMAVNSHTRKKETTSKQRWETIRKHRRLNAEMAHGASRQRRTSNTNTTTCVLTSPRPKTHKMEQQTRTHTECRSQTTNTARKCLRTTLHFAIAIGTKNHSPTYPRMKSHCANIDKQLDAWKSRVRT